MTDATSDVQLPAVGTYRIDPSTSTITFTTRHMFGLGAVKGSFDLNSGDRSTVYRAVQRAGGRTAAPTVVEMQHQ